MRKRRPYHALTAVARIAQTRARRAQGAHKDSGACLRAIAVEITGGVDINPGTAALSLAMPSSDCEERRQNLRRCKVRSEDWPGLVDRCLVLHLSWVTLEGPWRLRPWLRAARVASVGTNSVDACSLEEVA